ncbi:protein KINESIN LIGHT CHAIN-RELATED 3-like [Prosopis cineraria]|uniref:protein KINESIN LIGHT CHAIN-RELATED 3-like n=1 Tax=Prosopis cineraria TaxID=364024 RepID=UPI00240F2EC9|nr:protein KINESIN LIGHT CHAIN-RELATED 3-like [Prosopis cineraria]
MPGILTNGFEHNERANEMNGNPSPCKETATPVKPEGSSFGQQSPQNADPNVPVLPVDTSIEQLYENVCDMESSDHSPSRQSLGSDGNESRIDSELCHLVGGTMREVEIIEEEVAERSRGDSFSETSSRKGTSEDGEQLVEADERIQCEKLVQEDEKIQCEELVQADEKMQSATTSSVSSDKSNKESNSRADLIPKTPPKLKPKGKSPPTKPPTDKRNDKPLRKQNAGATPVKKSKNSPIRSLISQDQSRNSTESTSDKPEMGPVLLKQARDLISSGDNPQKALELALRAMRLFEKHADGKPSLELVMCLHVTAAIYSSLGQYHEAIPILQHSTEIPAIEEGPDHVLAKFAGHMQLGDTYAMLGQLENSIMCYTIGLEVQRKVFGETDPRFGETCRYVAEAHVQALQFDEAERLCQMALDIHKANGSPPSLEEAADRRLMGLICETKGNHEAALEHLILASMAMVANGQEVEVASVDSSIGDTYLSLSRYDEAVFAYQKALTVFKTSKGENHPAVGSIFVRLADLYNRIGKIRESKCYCESALRIYEKPMPGIPPEETASGLMDISAIYESMNELEQALKLLPKALEIYKNAPGRQSTVAGIEAQMGVMHYMLGNYTESYNTLKNAILKLRATGEKKSAFFAVALNQMGLACVQQYALSEATELFEEAKNILEKEYGPYHHETLGIYSNLAGTYDAMGRVDEAIQILEYVVGMREEKLGTANPDVDDEKRRLSELLKEAGRVRSRTARSLETLLDANAPSENGNMVINVLQGEAIQDL